MAETFCRIPCN